MLMQNKIGNIYLKQGASKSRLMLFYVLIFIHYFESIFIDTSTIFMLKSPKFLNLPEAELANTVSKLFLTKQITRMVLDTFSGTLHDLSSKISLLFALLVLSLSLFAMPFIKAVFPLLYLLK